MSSQRTVPGVGPPNAKIVIVGEAPGAEEELQGVPFVGASGKLLNEFLAKTGIARQECYLTNVVKVRPSNNRFETFYADPKRNDPLPLLQKSIETLFEEIRRISPNVICCLGAEPLRALTGHRSISSWRGSIIGSAVGKVVPTFHPSFILRSDFSDAPTFQLDLRRVRAESLTSALNLPLPHLETDPSFVRVKEFLALRPHRIALDIETVGDLVRCIGLADSPNHALCIPFTLLSPSGGSDTFGGSDTLFSELASGCGSGTSRWSPDEEHEILRELYALLADPSVEKVLQNFPFDSTILARQFGLHISGLHMDTLLAQHTCHPELPKGLDYQCSIYTRIPCYWEYDASSDQSTFLYNCFDCIATYEISLVHDKQMVSLGVDEFYHSHVQPSMIALTRAQNRGVRIDDTARQELITRSQTRQTDALSRLHLAAGFDLNPNSPKQMQEFLYGKLGLAIQTKRDGKTRELKPTTDEDALGKLRKKYPTFAPIIDLCLLYREETKRLSFLTGELLNGKLFTSYNVAGTLTGRLSSSAPIINPATGRNFQQVERGEVRRMFSADPGWVLVKSDLSQADFRVVVWLARIERLIERLSDPKFDIHRWNAAHNIFSISEEAVTKDQRTAAKASVHGSNYGMGPDKVIKLYPQFTYKQAEALQERYHASFPEIKSTYWRETQEQLQLNRTLWTPLGRRRMFMGRWNDDLFRQAYAHRPQAIVGDIINRAFHLGDAIFDEARCYPLMQIHDEIVWCCREEYVIEAVVIIRRLMQYPVTFPNTTKPLIIPADISIGSNWFDQLSLEKWLCKNNAIDVNGNSLL